MLVVMWLNATRMCVMFDGKETVGEALFAKIAMIPSALLVAVQHTAYYVASHTGSLDRVFTEVDLSAAELRPKYGRRAKVLAVVCSILVTPNVAVEAYNVYAHDRNYLLSLLSETFPMPTLSLGIVKLVFVLLQVLACISAAFPQALKYVISALYSLPFLLFLSYGLNISQRAS